MDVYFQNGTAGSMMEYPVIVDTGSSNLAVAVEGCTNCESGSTGLELGWYGENDDSGELCIDVTYGSGSWDGMMTDKVKVGFVDGSVELVDEVYLAGITSQDGFFCGGTSCARVCLVRAWSTVCRRLGRNFWGSPNPSRGPCPTAIRSSHLLLPSPPLAVLS